MMATQWTFPHRDTGAICVATFDDGLLTVEVIDDNFDDDDSWDDDPFGETVEILCRNGIERTCVANRDAAYRELRRHADSADLDRSETVQ